jgi:lysophospholipase L1-like esterase
MKKLQLIAALIFPLVAASPLFAQDWPNFTKYREQNEALAPPAKGENRVVFMGNSITEGWSKVNPEFFEGKPYVNRGISGQTTPQMLVRFRADVIDLKPAVVVILAGTNDIAGNTGPSTLEMIADNIYSMAELARANGIKVVLSSVVPAYDYPWKPGLEPAPKIVALNKMIKDYADKNKIVYLDYFSAMADNRNGLPKELAEDGVHPTKAGYEIMGPLAEAAVAKALKSK